MMALLLPALAYIAIQSNNVQIAVVKKLIGEYSSQINTKITFSDVKVSFFDKIVVSDLYIEDIHGDTLLYSKRSIARFKSYDKNKKIIQFRKLRFEDALINLHSDNKDSLNLAYFLDAIKENRDTTKQSMDISSYTLQVVNSVLKYKQDNRLPQNGNGTDFGDIELYPLDLYARDFNKTGDTTSLKIINLSAKDKSGLELKKYRGYFSFTQEYLLFDQFMLESVYSYLSADKVHLKFRNFKDLGKDMFPFHVNMDAKIIASSINLDELGLIVPSFRNIDHDVQVSGHFYGKINNLKGKQLHVDYNEHTEFIGNFDMWGLPRVNETYMYINIDKFTTNMKDLQSIRFNQILNKDIHFPKQLFTLGNIGYKGKFSGFFDDFVAYGRLNTSLGRVNTDILIRPDTSRTVRFKGEIATSNFNLSPLVDSDSLIGSISMKANINGYNQAKHGLRGLISGNIKALEFNRYIFSNIDIEGTITNEAYDGALRVSDPNLNLDFLGRVEFASDTPVFDFTVNIPHANPVDLNIMPNDSIEIASLILTANFVGNNLDNLNGDVKLINAYMKKPNREINLFDINLIAENYPGKRTLKLNSSYADASMSGNYDLSTLKESFLFLLQRYLPSIKKEEKTRFDEYDNQFSFNATLKNTSDITGFFMPELSISDNSTLNGYYNPTRGELNFIAETKYLKFRENVFTNLFITGEKIQNKISIESGSKLLSIKDQVKLDNFSNYIDITNDSIKLISRSNNWNTILNKGTLEAYAVFSKKKINNSTLVDITLKPATILVKNDEWKLYESTISIDSTSIVVNDFQFAHAEQFFKVEGKISEEKDDLLFISMNNLDFSVINVLIPRKIVEFGGLVSGDIIFSDMYKQSLVQGNLKIDELSMNDEIIGKTKIATHWISDKKALDIQSRSLRGELETLLIAGYYYPTNRNLDFNISLNKLRLNAFSPYMAAFSSELKGIANGELTLSGLISKPLLEGNVELLKTSFRVDYLNCYYNFDTDITIENNNAYFKDVVVYDEKFNTTLVNGSFNTTYLKNPSIDLVLKPSGAMLLNTTENDNQLFYGRAFASGIVELKGPLKSISLNVNATSEKNTQLFIPLNSSEEISETNFIKFNSKSNRLPLDEVEKKEYQKTNGGLKMGFNLNITPEAEVQLIFDPKVGDIMKGRGYGNISMDATPDGDFRINGDYTIEQGDYLFTLQNIINKRFQVEEGGRIEWNGKPTDATVDIKAVYQTKASLYEILPAEYGDEFKKRIPVECQIFMTEKLMNPNIRFDIFLPTAEEETRSLTRNAISTEDELSKQFLSLLVINSFMPDQSREQNLTEGVKNNSNLGVAGVGVTASELFSNQLSNWLSQMSNDFDLGFNYRPGDEISSDEVEMAFSTQLLNERVRIYGNVDVGGNQTTTSSNTSNIVGDFSVDIKLTQNGKLRLKAYNKANDIKMYEDAPYTQGVGLFYREEFDSVEGLLKNYWQRLFGKKEEETQIEEKTSSLNY